MDFLIIAEPVYPFEERTPPLNYEPRCHWAFYGPRPFNTSGTIFQRARVLEITILDLRLKHRTKLSPYTVRF